MKPRIFIEIFVGLLILGLAMYFVFNQIMNVVVHYRKEVTVPYLTGKSVTQALVMLSPLNLGLKKAGEQFDRKLPPYSILTQLPTAGTKVREGRIISVILSRGGEMVFVPDLFNLSIREAELVLHKERLVLGEETSQYSLGVRKGLVIMQDPRAGNTVGKESLVNVIISLGTPPDGTVQIPNFVGKNISEAELWVRSQGMNITQVTSEKNSDSPSGTIISQEPVPESKVNLTTKLNFIVTIP